MIAVPAQRAHLLASDQRVEIVGETLEVGGDCGRVGAVDESSRRLSGERVALQRLLIQERPNKHLGMSARNGLQLAVGELLVTG